MSRLHSVRSTRKRSRTVAVRIFLASNVREGVLVWSEFGWR